MTAEPAIEYRAAIPYVSVQRSVTMTTIGEIADRLPELAGWLASRGLAPAGGPFFRYHVIDMPRLVIEAGFPVAGEVPIEGDLKAGSLPAGRYVTVTHAGHPEGLLDVTADLLAWAEKEGLTWDMTEKADGQHWGARLEFYNTDPRVEPDMNKWQMELAFRLAD
jgi:effector-binding domain-containing protein